MEREWATLEGVTISRSLYDEFGKVFRGESSEPQPGDVLIDVGSAYEPSILMKSGARVNESGGMDTGFPRADWKVLAPMSDIVAFYREAKGL